MKIEILYTNKSRHIKPVAEAMARWVKTYAKSIDDFEMCIRDRVQLVVKVKPLFQN